MEKVPSTEKKVRNDIKEFKKAIIAAFERLTADTKPVLNPAKKYS